jgi:hypothetical protein
MSSHSVARCEAHRPKRELGQLRSPGYEQQLVNVTGATKKKKKTSQTFNSKAKKERDRKGREKKERREEDTRGQKETKSSAARAWRCAVPIPALAAETTVSNRIPQGLGDRAWKCLQQDQRAQNWDDRVCVLGWLEQGLCGRDESEPGGR